MTIFRKELEPIDGEDQLNFSTRRQLAMHRFKDAVRKHGPLYMIRFGDNDIRPMHEDQIDISKLSQEILSPVGMPFDCIL